MKKFSLVLAALLVGGSLYGADEGIVINGTVTTDSTVSGIVDVKNEGKLNVGGITITGDKSKVGKEAIISSTTKLKHATVDGSEVGIGNIDITNSPIEKGKIITDSQIDHINAKDSTANIGNIKVENSTMTDGELNSITVSTGTIELDKGTLNMGNISLKENSKIDQATIKSDVGNFGNITAKEGGVVEMGNITLQGGANANGSQTEIKSTVKNFQKIEAIGGSGDQKSVVDLGSIAITGGVVDGGSKVTSTVTNYGTISAKQGGAVAMGRIESDNATIRGATVSSTVTVTSSGSVTATGAGSQANFGGIKVRK